MQMKREHHLGKDEVRQRVDNLSATLAAKFNVRCHWRGDEMHFKGNGVNGCIAVSETRVDVDVKLGFALKLMEPTIRSSIEEALDEHLG